MYVIKRDHGTGVEKKEPVSFDRITERIVNLANGLSEHVDAVEVAQKALTSSRMLRMISLEGPLCVAALDALDVVVCNIFLETSGHPGSLQWHHHQRAGCTEC